MHSTWSYTPIALVIASMFSTVAGTPQNPAGAEQLPKPPVSVMTYREAKATAPMPLAERIRRGTVPKRGFVSTGIDGGTLISGDGKMMVELPGNPLSDQVTFRHERLLQPWKTPFKAPKIAQVLPEVRKLIFDGKYREALELSFKASTDAGMPPGTRNHGLITPFTMRIEIPEAGRAKDYLRTTDFESGELNVYWTDNRGDWVRRTFVSRPDNVVVQYLTAPKGQTLNTTIAINTGEGRGSGRGGAGGRGPADGGVRYEREFNAQRMIVMGHFSPDTGNIGFAGVTRVVLNGGSARMENDRLVVSDAQSLLLLTRIEWYHDYNRAQVDALVRAVDQVPADYAALAARQRKVQSEMIDRASMNFGGSAQVGMSSEELLADQRTHQGYGLST